MLNQRHPELVEGRSLPQRKGQLNSSIHRVYVSPRLIRQVGFNTNAVLADALISGRVFFLWTKKSLKRMDKVVRRHIFGFFILSLSAIQFLPTTNAAKINNSTVSERSAPYTINDSVKAKEAPIFQRPVKGYISQGFWYFHTAIDIPKPYGTKIKPIAEGLVTYAGWDGGYGYSIIIKHKASFSSRYAHLSQIFVKKGVKVNKKTVIGLIGTTGYATGSHIHLEMYNEGKLVDPQKYLPKR